MDMKAKEDFEIPKNATIRYEYVRCGNPDCKKCNNVGNEDNDQKHTSHGPYLYAYWKENKKLKKRYLGKSWEDLKISEIAKRVHLTPAAFRKSKFIREEVSKGNPLAVQYYEKLRNDKVSLDWAYRVIIDGIRHQRISKMLTIADKKNYKHDNENELVEFVASEMQKEGLDPTNEENVDGYLNSEVM